MYQRRLNVATMTIKRYYNDFDMRYYSTLRSGQSGAGLASEQRWVEWLIGGGTEGCARSITCTDSCSPDVKSGPILM